MNTEHIEIIIHISPEQPSTFNDDTVTMECIASNCLSCVV